MKELSFASLSAGDVNLNKTLTFYRIDGNYYISSLSANSFDITNNSVVAKYWYVNKKRMVYYRKYGPASITFFRCYWYSKHGEEITDEINDWLDSKNIVLSKDNDYEIPDEHKTEFRLRFH